MVACGVDLGMQAIRPPTASRAEAPSAGGTRPMAIKPSRLRALLREKLLQHATTDENKMSMIAFLTTKVDGGHGVSIYASKGDRLVSRHEFPTFVARVLGKPVAREEADQLYALYTTGSGNAQLSIESIVTQSMPPIGPSPLSLVTDKGKAKHPAVMQQERLCRNDRVAKYGEGARGPGGGASSARGWAAVPAAEVNALRAQVQQQLVTHTRSETDEIQRSRRLSLSSHKRSAFFVARTIIFFSFLFETLNVQQVESRSS